MIVKIREIIRDCITFGMHFIYTRIYQMNIDKSAKLSFGAKLDKSNPKEYTLEKKASLHLELLF